MREALWRNRAQGVRQELLKLERRINVERYTQRQLRGRLVDAMQHTLDPATKAILQEVLQQWPLK